jgi:hypothetical protein
MAYGLLYYSEFDNLAEQGYRLEILKKDYTGSSSSVLLSGDPVRQRWETDEVKAAIKGCSMVVNLLNQTGRSEDFGAVVELDFVDMGIFYQSIILISDTTFIPQAGVPFTVSGHIDPTVNGSYTPLSFTQTGAKSYSIDFAVGADQPTSVADASTITGLNNVPISTFYSINDDEFKGRFYWGSQLLFEGFLVQDDCSELMADYAHEITLSFNDNLGLLKDVTLDENLPEFGGWVGTVFLDFIAPTPDNFIYIFNSGYTPQVGVPFTMSGHIDPAVNTTFTPLAVTDYYNGNYIVQVTDLLFLDSVSWATVIEDAGGNIDLYQRNSLLNLIRICLYNTGLELDTYIYANVFETSHTEDRSFLEQTFIETKTFIAGGTFMSCYDVLTYILGRFDLTLFQSKGAWHIFNTDEVRYYPTTHAIPYYKYDSDFAFVETGVFEDNFSTGDATCKPENGLFKSIFRPFKFAKETFNYKQPEFLINNSNLATLGTFDSTSSDAEYRYDVYEFPTDSKWIHFFPGDPKVDISQIVVKYNLLTGDEVERYVLQPKTDLSGGVGNEYFASVQFNDVPVSQGDRMDFEIKIKSASSTGGDAVLWRFGYILLSDEGSYFTLTSGGTWNENFFPPNDEAPGFSHTVLAAEAEEYFEYTLSQEVVAIPAFPIDGVLRIRVYGSNTTNASQPDVNAIWKDINLTITQDINDSMEVIGQVHTSAQTPTIKNTSDVEILFDDSPRNSIAGTLYRTQISGVVLNRTSQWYRLTNPSEELRLGNITTFEHLFWRRLPRTRLEGNYIGLIQDGVHVSMLSILTFSQLPGLNFGFGMLEIDYKNQSFNGTQWELCTDTEEDADLTSTYTFNYIYDSE